VSFFFGDFLFGQAKRKSLAKATQWLAKKECNKYPGGNETHPPATKWQKSH
jgi:hypothetical protein